MTTLLLSRATRAGTADVPGAGPLTVEYVRPDPHTIVVTILREGRVAGAGTLTNAIDPLDEGRTGWRGEIGLDGVRFWGTGRATAEGLLVTLERARLARHLPVPGWAAGMVGPIVEVGE